MGVAGLALISSVVGPGTHAHALGQGVQEKADDMSVTIPTDSRTERPGMATVVSTNSKRYLFDCRGAGTPSDNGGV